MTTAAVGYEPVYAWVKQVVGVDASDGGADGRLGGLMCRGGPTGDAGSAGACPAA